MMSEKLEQDCCFEQDGNWFRFRAGAIIIENECVLFAGNDEEDYFYSIGGGVHMNELAEVAVKREVFEETGVYYEIAFYYLMKPRGTQELNSDSYTHGVKEKMIWIPIKDLDKYKAFPTFLKDYLANPKNEIVHIITKE